MLGAGDDGGAQLGRAGGPGRGPVEDEVHELSVDVHLTSRCQRWVGACHIALSTGP